MPSCTPPRPHVSVAAHARVLSAFMHAPTFLFAAHACVSSAFKHAPTFLFAAHARVLSAFMHTPKLFLLLHTHVFWVLSCTHNNIFCCCTHTHTNTHTHAHTHTHTHTRVLSAFMHTPHIFLLHMRAIALEWCGQPHWLCALQRADTNYAIISCVQVFVGALQFED